MHEVACTCSKSGNHSLWNRCRTKLFWLSLLQEHCSCTPPMPFLSMSCCISGCNPWSATITVERTQRSQRRWSTVGNRVWGAESLDYRGAESLISHCMPFLSACHPRYFMQSIKVISQTNICTIDWNICLYILFIDDNLLPSYMWYICKKI